MNLRNAMLRGCSAALFLVLLGACAAKPAPEIRGRWTPVNRFQAQTAEIPLQPAHAYFATPMDRTLKGMLERWARDARMKLAYEHGSDFTLHAPVSDIRTNDLAAAVQSLNTIYAPQQVVVGVEGGRITVRRAGAGQ